MRETLIEAREREKRAQRIRAMSNEMLVQMCQAVHRDRAEGYPADYGQEYLDEAVRRAVTVAGGPRG